MTLKLKTVRRRETDKQNKRVKMYAQQLKLFFNSTQLSMNIIKKNEYKNRFINGSKIKKKRI